MLDELYHYGTKEHSGRYPWGSGETPYQRLDRGSFVATATKLKNDGWSDREIAEYFYGEGASTSEFNRRLRNAKADQKEALRAKIIQMNDQGMGASAIGHELGMNESTVRSMLDPVKAERAQKTQNVANILSEKVSDTNYIDISPGTETLMGISRSRLQSAVQRLVDSGDYEVQIVHVQQMALPDKYTNMQVLVPAGVTKGDVFKNLDRVNPVTGLKTSDGGKTWYGLEEPTSLDSKRIKIRYAEEGGKDQDGVIELRRGVEDISLDRASYAQVRIAVDGTHYLKGMAVYSDDLPPGVDVVFNTNKHEGTPMMGPKDNTVLKNLKDDPDNPFGSLLKVEDGEIVGQRHYTGADGKDHLSPINIVREEGDWDTWSRNLPAQFASKQKPALAKKQLKEYGDQKQAEFEEIMSLTNPEIKKKLLLEFADNCDSAAVHLKAAALPRQRTKVILPVPELKDTEVYAPTMEHGEQVMLVRFPHGGPFESPILTVNNNSKEARARLGDAQDAIGINASVAERLSGADFDGDTVLCIPTRGQNLTTMAPLRGLQDFDPKESYPLPKDYGREVGKKISEGGDGFNTQKQMGVISNLITDMTIRGATSDEIARAVRHSMVVIDAEKHQLNWKQSEIDNNIAELKNKYQKKDGGRPGGGASTLLSRAKSEERVNHRKEIVDVSKMTEEEKAAWRAGKKVYRDSGEVTFSGKPKQIKSTKMAETDDAYTLSSGTVIEGIYADHANRMKAMANEARKAARGTPNSKYDPQAAKVYANEVASLTAKLNEARKNKPFERKAQILANTIIEAKKADNPSLSEDYDQLKKARVQALNQARTITGANKKSVAVHITPKEWNAIQAHALSSAKIQEILSNTNEDEFRRLATPRPTKVLTDSQRARVQSMYNSGNYGLYELATKFGVSPSTISSVVRD